MPLLTLGSGFTLSYYKTYTYRATIKAHQGAADIFEWTIGYTFHHDPNNFKK